MINIITDCPGKYYDGIKTFFQTIICPKIAVWGGINQYQKIGNLRTKVQPWEFMALPYIFKGPNGFYAVRRPGGKHAGKETGSPGRMIIRDEIKT
jgi:hypothetical protein